MQEPGKDAPITERTFLCSYWTL